MGRWSQSQLRGGAGVPSALAAPILHDDGGENLSWSWDGADPFQWILEQSADGITAWATFANPAGSDRAQFGVDPDFFYRIYGSDGSSQVTATSNVVGPT